ncbi:unnamed protein product [Cuscuta europaea]|uniref:Uncharacterized protein n=1 Tax=Cuscuta europaea TaxID=41803 RepID=A0A9P0ZZ65_CUSEU|nr:unnamed protein product [Cuscuta europaea]
MLNRLHALLLMSTFEKKEKKTITSW